jgi:outer membrane protein assembly factor BamB
VFVLASRDIISNTTTDAETNLYEIAAADGTHLVRDGFAHERSLALAPTLAGNQLFAPVSGALSAFSIGASLDLRWRFVPSAKLTPDEILPGNLLSRSVSEGIASGAAYAGGVIYVTGSAAVDIPGMEALRDDLFAVRGSDGAELWHAQINGGGDALTPVVAGGVVFASANGAVQAQRAADGQRLWKYPAPGGPNIGEISALQVG